MTLYPSLTVLLPQGSPFKLPAFVNPDDQAPTFLETLHDPNALLTGSLPPRLNGAPLFSTLGGAVQLSSHVLIFEKLSNNDVRYVPAIFQLSAGPQSALGYSLFFGPSLWDGIEQGTGSSGETIPFDILERRLGKSTLDSLAQARRNRLKLHIDAIIQNAKDWTVATACPDIITPTRNILPFWAPLKRDETTLPYHSEVKADLTRIANLVAHHHALDEGKSPLSWGLHVGLYGGQVGQRGYLSPLTLQSTQDLSGATAGLMARMIMAFQNKYTKSLGQHTWLGIPGHRALYISEVAFGNMSGHDYMRDMAWIQGLS